MAVRFETYLSEDQARFIRSSLIHTIESMKSLLHDLARENGRWRTAEGDTLLARDTAEIAALQHMVDELSQLQKEHDWRDPPDGDDARHSPTVLPEALVVAGPTDSRAPPSTP